MPWRISRITRRRTRDRPQLLEVHKNDLSGSLWAAAFLLAKNSLSTDRLFMLPYLEPLYSSHSRQKYRRQRRSSETEDLLLRLE